MQNQHIILRVGRGDEGKDGKRNDIKVDHPSVSRSHLEVFIDEEGRVFITDLNSQNGTFVNGNRITGDYMLKDGDILKLGGSNPLLWKHWASGRYEQSRPSVDELGVPESNYKTTFGAPQKNKKKILIALSVAAAIALIVACFFFFKDSNSSEETIQYLSLADFKKKQPSDVEKMVGIKTVRMNKDVKNGAVVTLANGQNIVLSVEQDNDDEGTFYYLSGYKQEDGTPTVTTTPTPAVSNGGNGNSNTTPASPTKPTPTTNTTTPPTTNTTTTVSTNSELKRDADPNFWLAKSKDKEAIDEFIVRVKKEHPELKTCKGLNEEMIKENNQIIELQVDPKNPLVNKKYLKPNTWIKFPAN